MGIEAIGHLHLEDYLGIAELDRGVLQTRHIYAAGKHSRLLYLPVLRPGLCTHRDSNVYRVS